MAKILVRKVVLLVVLVPLLHMAGFWYALRVFPQFVGNVSGITGFSGSFGALAGDPDASELSPPPFWNTYRAYLARTLRGDLGRVGGAPLSEQLTRPITNSAVLVGTALALTVVLGFPLGIAALSRRTGRVSAPATLLLTAGSSLPSYFFAAVTITIVIGIVRAGYRPLRDVLPWQGFGFDQHLILPVAALAVRPIFYIARVVAGLVEDELQQDYVRTARSKGVPWHGLLWRHALPNTVSPVLVAIGQSLRIVVGQLIVIEALFNWPGLGRMFLGATGIRTDGGPPSPFFGNPFILSTFAVVFGVFLLSTDLIASVFAYNADPRQRRAVSTAGRA